MLHIQNIEQKWRPYLFKTCENVSCFLWYIKIIFNGQIKILSWIVHGIFETKTNQNLVENVMHVTGVKPR